MSPTPCGGSDLLFGETYTLLSHLNDPSPAYETFCFDIEQKSSGSTTSHSDHSLPEYESFGFIVDHIEEKSSGSTTSHSDLSLHEYELFHFDLSIDPLPPADRSDSHLGEFADELAHIISPLKIAVIMEYLVNISKRRAFWSLKEDILKINDSDNQYAVSIKEDTAYSCLHSPKTTKETSSIRRIQRRSIRSIQDIVCKDSGRYQTWMDDPNITMEEYIRLEEEKAHRRGKVYNWKTATYGKIWYNEDVHNLGSVETEFPAIVLNDVLTSKVTLSCEPTLNAMNVEMQSMKDNEVWDLVELPPNSKTIGSKWLFKKKTEIGRAVHTYKARLMAKGYNQTPRIDYEETFSPVADIRAIMILIAITTLKQASRQWNKRFDDEIKKFGFTQNCNELCVYLKASGSNVTFLILYVDDILIMGNNIPMLKDVKSYLGRCFAMKDLGEATYILGIKIYKDRSRRLLGDIKGELGFLASMMCYLTDADVTLKSQDWICMYFNWMDISSLDPPKSTLVIDESTLLVTPLPDSKEISLREVERFDPFFSLTQSGEKTRVMEIPSFVFHHMPSSHPAAYLPTEGLAGEFPSSDLLKQVFKTYEIFLYLEPVHIWDDSIIEKTTCDEDDQRRHLEF
ncbi:retrotransposon protein, putative, ty1-copia subclass [Tanacetum coccineum]